MKMEEKEEMTADMGKARGFYSGELGEVVEEVWEILESGDEEVIRSFLERLKDFRDVLRQKGKIAELEERLARLEGGPPVMKAGNETDM